MTTETKMKPLTAEEAERICDDDPWRDPVCIEPAVADALVCIADGRHRVIDTATHTEVTHEELERLRAVEAAARAVCRESVNPATGGRLILEADIERLDRAIDAAQQEEGDESRD